MRTTVWGMAVLTLVLGFVCTGCPDTNTSTVEQYTLMFYANGGSIKGQLDQVKKVEAGARAGTLPEPDANADYYFWGWFTQDGTNGWGGSFDEDTPVTKDILVYARWESTMPARECIITFNPQGGSVSPISVKIYAGDSITLPTPKRNGYTFIGWSTEVDGSGSTFTGSTPFTQNMTLYAQWIKVDSSSNNSFLGEILTLSGDVYYLDFDNKKFKMDITKWDKGDALITTDNITTEGTITNGKFSMVIEPDDFRYLKTINRMLDTIDLPFLRSEYYDNVLVSDISVKGGFIEIMDVYNHSMGHDEFAMLKGSFTASGDSSNGTASQNIIIYMYVDGDVTLSGKGKTTIDGYSSDCTTKTNDVSLSFKKGWNAVCLRLTEEQSSAGENRTMTISLENPPSFKWTIGRVSYGYEPSPPDEEDQILPDPEL